MIIATAGHIDHGKTALVRALTGVDTDRLKEEKARGISIELGYAYVPVSEEESLGFVDVPGHERLIHTMVAGACGIDFALLVIAADDGVMPQTREHLDILELLGITRGAVVLTKIDRVDEARVHAVCDQVTALIAPGALADSPIFSVNALDAEHAGIAMLRTHLHACATQSARREDRRLFRLAIDRVFTLSGHGTIVAGTVFSGRVCTGDTVHVMPSGKAARVRNLHAQNRPAEVGRVGQRCALNLAGVQTEEVSRGDWLADPRALAPTLRMDVRLALQRSAAHERTRALGAWSPVHVHLGTAHRLAHVVPLEHDMIGCGEAALAQLVFEQSLCALPGDRFIVRNAQATRTIGGGTVLDPYAPARRRRTPRRLQWLSAIEAWNGSADLSQILDNSPLGIDTLDLIRLTGLLPEHLDLPTAAMKVEAGGHTFIILSQHWVSVGEAVLRALADFHAQAPDEPGPDAARLARMAAPTIARPLWQVRLAALLEEGRILRKGVWLSLPQHVVVLGSEEQALALRLRDLIDAGGFDPPWVRDLATAVREPEPRVRNVLRKAAAQGLFYQVVPDLFYAGQRIGQLAGILEGLARKQGAVRAACYRDAVGLGRKRAIQILEFFDRIGYTRRLNDAHVPRRDGPWSP
jgi:selenocysteine-specific elongation factor